MVKRTTQKKRESGKRKERCILLIGLEGRNKTEKGYFTGLSREQNQYIVKYSDKGDTDPISIMEMMKQEMKRLDFDPEEGDVAICMIDTDTDLSKQDQIDRAVTIGKHEGISLCLSNPCFEIWYLLHYKYTTKQFISSEALIRELKKHIPDYEKKIVYYDSLKNRRTEAIRNAKKLEQYHYELHHPAGSMTRNPSTDVYQVVEMLDRTERKDNKIW